MVHQLSDWLIDSWLVNCTQSCTNKIKLLKAVYCPLMLVIYFISLFIYTQKYDSRKQSMKPITSAQQLQQRNSRNSNKYAIICKSGKSRTTERASSCRADAAGRLMLPVLLQRAFSCTVSDCECVWTHWAPCILWGICAVGRHVCAREWETEMRGSSLCWAVWVQVLINEEEWWLRLA